MIATGPVSFALAMSLAVGVEEVLVGPPPPEPSRVKNRVTPTEMAITRSTATAINSHFNPLFCFGGGGGCCGPHPGGE
jgi:hypothetical protein